MNSSRSATRTVGWAAIGAALVISSLAFLGWALDVPLLKSIEPQWIPMKLITVACFVLSAAALALVHSAPPEPARGHEDTGKSGSPEESLSGTSHRPRHTVARVLALVVIAAGLLTAVVYATELATGLEASLAGLPLLSLFLSPGARMALLTAIIFVFLGFSIVLLSTRGRRSSGVAHAITFPAAMASYLVPVSYLLGVQSLHDWLGVPVALNTGIAFCALCIAVFCARPHTWFMNAFTGDHAGSAMARRLLPGLLVLPLVIGWFRLRGEQTGVFRSEVGVTLVALAYTICFLGLVWLSARSVNRTDDRRRAAERAVQESERRYRSLFSRMSEGVVLHELVRDETGEPKDYRILDVNPAFESITGLTREQSIGKLASDLYGTGAPPYFDIYRRVAESDVPEAFESFFAPMGKHFHISVYSPGPGRFATVFTDITERKQAEQRLAESHEELEVSAEELRVQNDEMAKAHARLSESEATLRGILDATQESIWLFSPDAVVLSANAIALKRFGKTGEEAIGKHMNEILPPDLAQLRLARLREILESGRSLEFEDQRAGIEFRHSFYPVLTAEGRVSAVVSFSRDITERKRVGEKVRYQALLLENVNDAVYGLDNEFRITSWNKGAETILGWTAEEAIGKEILGLIKSEMAEAESQANRERMLKGEAIRTDAWVTDKLGNRLLVEIATQRVLDPQGQAGGSVVVLRDITERKRAEQALRESELKFRTVADNTYDFEFWLDPEGRYLYASPSCERITGYRPAEFIADPELRFRIVHPEDQDLMRRHREDAEKEKPGSLEHRIIRRDGAVRWISHVCQPVFDESRRFLGTRGSNRDITERVQAEQKLAETHEELEVNAEELARQNEDLRTAEESLRATSEYLEKLLAYANAPIIVWDPQLRITRFNHAFERLTGRRAEYVVGKGLELLFPPDRCEGIMTLIRGASSGEHWEVVEIPIQHVAGEVRTVLWNSALLLDSDGRTPVATIAQGQDVTERSRAETALRETRDYLENLINYANAPIIVWNPQLRITQFNNAFERLTGRRAPDVVGKGIELLFPTDRREGIMALIRRASTGERWEVVEIPIQHVGGEVRTVLWNSATLFAPDGKTAVATIAQGQDITERSRAEAALRETRDYLENLINYANAPIIVWNPQLRITQFNHAFERLTGRSAKDVIGQELDLLFPADRRYESLDLIRRTATGERWETVEISIQHKDGSVRTVLWNSATLFAPDGRTAVATIAQGQDITERKHAEQALAESNEELEVSAEELRVQNDELTKAQQQLQASLKEKELLLSEVHHRVKNNLQVVSSLLNLRFRKVQDAEARSAFEESQSRIRSIALIHERLYRTKDFARIDFGAYVSDLAPSLFRSLSVNPSQIRLTVGHSMVPLPLDTATPLGLIVNELVTNALKHAFPDGRTGNVSIDLAPAGDGKVVLTVRDDGVGLPPGLDPATSTNLGLQLVTMLVQQIQGGMEVIRGEGTQFRITFPVQV